MTENEKLDLIVNKIDQMDSRLDSMDSRLDSMDSKFDQIDSRLDNLELDMKTVKLTLENEVLSGLKRVAEGHLDLSRNLQKVIKNNNEFEMLDIRVDILEAKVRKLENQAT